MTEPLFDILFDVEQKIKQNLKPLPYIVSRSHKWSGIGFKFDNKQFLTNVKEINSVISIGKITVVPNSVSWLYGVMHYEGEILPVIILSEFLGGNTFQETLKSKIIVVKMYERLCGFIVDSVWRHVQVNPQHFEVFEDDEGLEYAHLIKNQVEHKHINWLIFSMRELMQSKNLEYIGL